MWKIYIFAMENRTNVRQNRNCKRARNISALQAGKENESEDSKYESKRTYRETKYQYKSI